MRKLKKIRSVKDRLYEQLLVIHDEMSQVNCFNDEDKDKGYYSEKLRNLFSQHFKSQVKRTIDE